MDKFLNLTAVQVIKTWATGLFAKAADLTTLSGRVDAIVAEGGEPNVIETVKVNGMALTPDANKAVDVEVPTKTSDLTNDSGFQNGTEVQDLIDASLAGITGIDFQVVQALPQAGEKGIIYLLSNSGTNPNIYDEYIWIDGDPSGSFEKIGTTEVDLSHYWTSTTGKSNTLEAATISEIEAVLNGE